MIVRLASERAYVTTGTGDAVIRGKGPVSGGQAVISGWRCIRSLRLLLLIFRRLLLLLMQMISAARSTMVSFLIENGVNYLFSHRKYHIAPYVKTSLQL